MENVVGTFGKKKPFIDENYVDNYVNNKKKGGGGGQKEDVRLPDSKEPIMSQDVRGDPKRTPAIPSSIQHLQLPQRRENFQSERRREIVEAPKPLDRNYILYFIIALQIYLIYLIKPST